MPERIQLRRTKGWRKPDGAVVVSRPSRWGNPFPVGKTVNYADFEGVYVRDKAHAVELYRQLVAMSPPEYFTGVRHHLAGRDLLCWCRIGDPCHADVLLEVAAGRLTAGGVR